MVALTLHSAAEVPLGHLMDRFEGYESPQRSESRSEVLEKMNVASLKPKDLHQKVDGVDDLQECAARPCSGNGIVT